MVKTWKCDECKISSSYMNSTSNICLRALESFFGNLKTYGEEFPAEFWDIVCKELIFPIFSVLKSGPSDMSRFTSQEDMSVWISTTMIQALRDTIDLWTFHFTILERFLDGLLDLLRSFICQGWYDGQLCYALLIVYRERHSGSHRNVLPATVATK